MTERTRFDPVRWSAFLAEDRRGALFRRGLEIAKRLVDDVRRPGDLWLDAGCGPGDLAHDLAASGLRVVALDADHAAATFVQRRDQRLAVIVGDAERLPLASGAVDGVVATSLAGCLGSLDRFLCEVGRTLRPGGAAVITFTNRPSVLLRVNRLLDVLFGGPPAEQCPGTIRAFSLGEVRRSLGAAGLVATAVRFYNFTLVVGRWSLPPTGGFEARIGSRHGRALARNFAVVAHKPGDGVS